MPSSALIFEIIGIDHASKAFEKVEHSTSKVEGKLSKLKIVGGLALAAIAVGAVEMAKKSVEKFQETGKEAIGLQRILGGTAEEVSRLNFAAEEKGIDTSKLTIGFRALSRHIGANDKAWKTLGVSTKDAHGKAIPFAELLPKIADKFQKMPAGTDKTAKALKLFGKSGTDLLPLLNLGSTGLEDFGKESDKLGHTLTGQQLDAIKKNIAAHRQFKAAVSGVEIQIGAALYPALAKIIPAVANFAATVAEKAIPVIKRFGTWMSEKLMPALSDAWKTILPGVKEAFQTVTSALGDGKGGWKSVGDVVIQFIKVAAVVIRVVLPAMAKLWANNITVIKLFATVCKTVFTFVTKAFLAFVGTFIDGAAKAFGWVPGIGGKLKAAAKKFDKFRDDVNRSLNGIQSHKEITIITKANLDFVQTGQSNKRKAAGARASGGPMRAGGAYLVGENGPELVVPGQDSMVIPNAGTKQALTGGGGGNVFVTVTGSLIGTDEKSLARELHKLLVQRKRETGTALGLA